MIHRKFVRGKLYHLYNRGNRKRKIYYNEGDYERFVFLLSKYDLLLDVCICGYCLMPNHFHLLVRSGGEGAISEFMRRLGIAYTKFFNTKYRFVGHVFQGRYQATEVTGVGGMRRVVEYIKDNPVKDGLVRESGDYRWLEIRYRRL